jgi:hypothetical protein
LKEGPACLFGIEFLKIAVSTLFWRLSLNIIGNFYPVGDPVFLGGHLLGQDCVLAFAPDTRVVCSKLSSSNPLSTLGLSDDALGAGLSDTRRLGVHGLSLLLELNGTPSDLQGVTLVVPAEILVGEFI